jgi:hypothetical protein
LLKM